MTRAPATEEPVRDVEPPLRGPADDRAFPVGWGRLALETLMVAIAAVLVTAVHYRLGDVRSPVPIEEGGGDARANASMIKTIDEHGWWSSNPQLNAPFAQEHLDYSAGGESLQLVVFKLLGAVLPGYGEVMNTYYLAGFTVVAVVAFLVLRHVRIPAGPAVIVALVYAFLPYHFFHGQAHLTRSTYFTAPLACLLLLWTLSWRSRFLRSPDAEVRLRSPIRFARALRWRRIGFAALLAAIIAASETMTASFTMTLLAASAVVAAVRWRDPPRLAISGGLILVMMVTFVGLSVPSLMYWADNGTNPLAGQREPFESELYGLKIHRLLLPNSDHRIDAWGEFGELAEQGTRIPSEGGQYLGVLGIAGLVGAMLSLLIHGLRGRGSRDVRPVHHRHALTDHGALIIVLAMLFGTVAGLNLILGALGFEEVRTWNRIVVIIGFFALLTIALWLESASGRLHARLRRPLPVLLGLGAVVLAVGLYDSTEPKAVDYAAAATAWKSDQRFVEEIDRRMPEGAAVFQLPVIRYPESPPVVNMQDYEHLRGFLHDDGSLRWSYAGVKGRPEADWQLVVGERGPSATLDALLGMGFQGIWVDRNGYADRGEALLTELAARTGTQPIGSDNDSLLFLDLRPYRKRLRLSDAQLRRLAERTFGVAPPAS